MTTPFFHNKMPASLLEILENLRVAWFLLRDSRIPSLLRFGVPLLVGMYVLLPIDFIPDLIPGLGQVDDLAALWLGLQYFLNVCPPEIVAEYRAAVRGETKPKAEQDVVDGSYEVVE